MIFKDVKVGSYLHILDVNSLTYKAVKVSNVSLPRVDMRSGKTDMVIDITTEDGNTYTIQDSASIAYASNLILSADKGGLIAEIDNIKTKAEKTLADVDKARMTIDRIPMLMAELDDSVKDKQRTEQRFDKIESTLGKLSEMVDKLVKSLG